ncbi:hypothetical protein PCE1_003152 [Barthelona sp. PCE]
MQQSNEIKHLPDGSSFLNMEGAEFFCDYFDFLAATLVKSVKTQRKPLKLHFKHIFSPNNEKKAFIIFLKTPRLIVPVFPDSDRFGPETHVILPDRPAITLNAFLESRFVIEREWMVYSEPILTDNFDWADIVYHLCSFFVKANIISNFTFIDSTLSIDAPLDNVFVSDIVVETGYDNADRAVTTINNVFPVVIPKISFARLSTNLIKDLLIIAAKNNSNSDEVEYILNDVVKDQYSFSFLFQNKKDGVMNEFTKFNSSFYGIDNKTYDAFINGNPKVVEHVLSDPLLMLMCISKYEAHSLDTLVHETEYSNAANVKRNDNILELYERMEMSHILEAFAIFMTEADKQEQFAAIHAIIAHSITSAFRQEESFQNIFEICYKTTSEYDSSSVSHALSDLYELTIGKKRGIFKDNTASNPPPNFPDFPQDSFISAKNLWPLCHFLLHTVIGRLIYIHELCSKRIATKIQILHQIANLFYAIEDSRSIAPYYEPEHAYVLQIGVVIRKYVNQLYLTDKSIVAYLLSTPEQHRIVYNISDELDMDKYYKYTTEDDLDVDQHCKTVLAYYLLRSRLNTSKGNYALRAVHPGPDEPMFADLVRGEMPGLLAYMITVLFRCTGERYSENDVITACSGHSVDIFNEFMEDFLIVEDIPTTPNLNFAFDDIRMWKVNYMEAKPIFR